MRMTNRTQSTRSGLCAAAILSALLAFNGRQGTAQANRSVVEAVVALPRVVVGCLAR